MMGELPKDQGTLFYDFCLERFVPQDHLLRRIDRFLDFEPIRQQLAPFYSLIGRPSVDPELMIRMLIVGYCYGIRSERQLCEDVHYHLAYRHFCRLGLEGKVPDHSTFTKNRYGRFCESDIFRRLFEAVVRQCMEEELIGAEGFAVDASLIRADASGLNGIKGDQFIDWGDPEQAARPIREYIAALDEATDEETDEDDQDPDQNPGKVEDKAPSRISLTDPQARWTAATRDRPFFGYSTNYLVDMKAGIIVDVEATPSYRPDEVNSTKTMIERVKEAFDIKPKHLIGDTAYGSGPMLDWLVNTQQIAPHIPVWEKGERKDGTFSRSDFSFDAASDNYTCPDGKLLKRYRRRYKKPRPGVTKAKTIKYRASQHDCEGCALKAQCCPNTASRIVTRSIYEAARDIARAIAKTDAYKKSQDDREKVEMLFAHLKEPLKLRRLRLRGLSGAKFEFTMAATVQNLRRLAMWRATGPPVHSQVALA